MSTASDPIQAEDFAPVAAALATPVTGDAVAASDPIPTDKYLTAEDVAATKAADAAAAAPAPTDEAIEIAATTTPAAKAPPADRWDTILDNARKKERAAVEGEYAWAKGMNRDEVEATREWISLGNQNPILALDKLVQGIVRPSPDQKAQIERYFTTVLREAGPAVAAAAAAAATPAVAATDSDPMPLPDIPTDTSNGVPVVYSDKQMLVRDQWLIRKIKSEVALQTEKDLAPLRTDKQQRDTEQQKIQEQAATDAYSAHSVAAIADKPGFELYRAEIAAAYAAMPLSDNSRSEGEKVRDAYLQVIISKMSDLARDEAVASVTRRAEAGTVDPSRQSAATPFDYEKATWEQALRHEFNAAALGR